MRNFWALILMLAARPAGATGSRLKELASLEGVRDNQLIGYGLVAGLSGTGDKAQTIFSIQTLTNMLRRMGVVVNPTQIMVRNIAAVMVTATLPPFAQPGTHIDITAAAIGDATNLQGGLLLMTALKDANGDTYAMAQGSLLTGGFAAGRGGNTQTVNHPTVGRVPGGAIVEKAPPSIEPATNLKLQLNEADYTTAAHIVDVLNKHFAADGAPIAHAESSALVSVNIPPAWASRTVEFVAEMEDLTVEPDRREKVVISEKTGTIVLGKDVRLSPVSILHGALTVEVKTTYEVSQPAEFSSGQTMVVPQTTVNTKEEKAKSISLEKGATVDQLVRALQAIGSTARDIITILESMRAAGALDADIEVL
jgi:flagellar P-ring protein FlgI